MRDASWSLVPAVPGGTVALPLRVPPVRPAVPGARARQSADLPRAPVVLRVPSLSPVAGRAAAEAALLLRSAALVFSITFGHLSHGGCPVLPGSDVS